MKERKEREKNRNNNNNNNNNNGLPSQFGYMLDVFYRI